MESTDTLPGPLPETAEDEAKLLMSTLRGDSGADPTRGERKFSAVHSLPTVSSSSPPRACVVAFCYRTSGGVDRPFHILIRTGGEGVPSQVGGMHPKELVERA